MPERTFPPLDPCSHDMRLSVSVDPPGNSLKVMIDGLAVAHVPHTKAGCVALGQAISRYVMRVVEAGS